MKILLPPDKFVAYAGPVLHDKQGLEMFLSLLASTSVNPFRV